jgi:hypothetical protein
MEVANSMKENMTKERVAMKTMNSLSTLVSCRNNKAKRLSQISLKRRQKKKLRSNLKLK